LRRSLAIGLKLNREDFPKLCGDSFAKRVKRQREKRRVEGMRAGGGCAEKVRERVRFAKTSPLRGDS
jgi:hypothetical protein